MHELGHSVVITHYGRKVKAPGFSRGAGVLRRGDGQLMLDRRQRIVQASAGPFMELVIAGIASLVIFAFRRSARGPPLQVRAPQLHRDLHEPGPAAGARRLLDPLDLIQVLISDRSLEFIQHDFWHKARRASA